MKITQIIPIILTCIIAKSNGEVSNCFVYGTTTFCLDSTDVPDSHKKVAAQIVKSSGILRENDFPRMANVQVIEFVSNNLTHIDPKFFTKFPNLSKLIIRGNNKFPNITKELLKHCKNLVNLKIYFNYGLNHIEENTLRNFPNLEKLVIRSERLQHLKKHDLQIVTSLRVLKLDLTTLKKIDSNAFEPISHLEKLSLMANNFLKINPEIFNSIRELKELNLIYAEITDLSFLKKLPKLQILQLAGNKINSIFADTFRGLTELKQLDLAHTGISHIDTSYYFFQNVPKLEKIDITCHNLTNELFDIVRFSDHNIAIIDKYTDIDREISC
ncbi:hypothetical protein WA026_014865 [Henosepilachna vigintioctopunctata]|uniref:Uncharacterized protein n=1 Tax=Henosepilachna vigintioctopunctata TaxID=420089 RepID=A0AAW1UY59_9CUCU